MECHLTKNISLWTPLLCSSAACLRVDGVDESKIGAPLGGRRILFLENMFFFIPFPIDDTAVFIHVYNRQRNGLPFGSFIFSRIINISLKIEGTSLAGSVNREHAFLDAIEIHRKRKQLFICHSDSDGG